jgi:glyceraldehyde-3-phosphate dehydrogenase/erythrose-4-phosphate dehydrogenase
MKTIKKILLTLTLGLTLISCSTDEPITNNTPDVNEPITTLRYYNLQWKSECNVTRLLIVNNVAETINSEFIFDRGFNQGDVVQLKMIRNGQCNTNTSIEEVAIWKWNNPEKNGQHIVMIKSCNTNCGVVLSEPFIVE